MANGAPGRETMTEVRFRFRVRVRDRVRDRVRERGIWEYLAANI